MNSPKLEILKRSNHIIVLSVLVVVMIMATGASVWIITPIHAVPANPYAKTLVIYLTLSGINSTTGDVLAFVKAHNVIQNSLFNATKLEMMGNRTDGIAQTAFSFQNLTLIPGEPYTTCVVILKDVKMTCMTDFKTPFARPQYVDISLQS
jgi:hypothetical protein